jgi:hypothetical protein
MKNTTIILLCALFPFLSFGQVLSGKLSGVNIVTNTDSLLKDTVPTVEYLQAKQGKKTPAIFIDHTLHPTTSLSALNPEIIEKMEVDKVDTLIAGNRYKGIIKIYTLDTYTPKWISIRDFTTKYIKLPDHPSIYFLDGKPIEGMIEKTLLDEKFIYKVTVEVVSTAEEDMPISLINLYTRSEKNIKKSTNLLIK